MSGFSVAIMNETSSLGVRQLRVVVETDNFEEAVRFYRDVLGLTEQAAFQGDDGAQVVILDAGRATLELANRAQTAMIDAIEVGRRVSPPIRLAFEVDNAIATTTRLAAQGANVLGAVRETPWRSLNARLEAPGPLQLTIFQELADLDVRTGTAGFGTLDDDPRSP